MVFRKNALDGPIEVVRTGSFKFDDLVNHADDPDNWDYWIINDDEMNDIPQICVLLGGDAFDNIDILNASNMMIPEIGIGKRTEGAYSPLIDGAVSYPPGTPEPPGFNLLRNSSYFKFSQVENESETMSFDVYTLYGENGIWDSSTFNIFYTDLASVLYLENGNCFGLGNSYTAIQAAGNNIQVQLTKTIFNQFMGTYGTWEDYSAWNAKVGGILDGSTMFTDLPWNAVAYSEFTQFKENFNQTATVLLPNQEFIIKGGFYLVGFKYNDIDYIGILGVKKNEEGVITGASIWGAGLDFWNVEGDTSYYVDPEGTVTKSTNPNYTKSSYLPLGKALPSAEANPLLHAAGGEKIVGGVRSGWKTYLFTKDDYDQFIAEIFNPKMTVLTDPTTKYSLSDVVTGWSATPGSNAVIQVYTLPVKSNYILTDSSSSNPCRCGGLNTTLSEKYRAVIDRVIQIEYYSSEVSRKARYLDYTNTNIEIFLPFVGTVPVNVMDAFFPYDAAESIRFIINYRIDVITGNFTVTFGVAHSDLSGARVVFSSSGNMSCPVPLGSSSNLYERLTSGVSSAVKGAMNIVTSAATGNVTGALMQGMNTAGEMANSISQSNAYAQLGGAPEMISGMYIPYVRIERPITPQDTFIGTAGYPSAACGTVGKHENTFATGFNSYRAVDVSGILTATEAEKQRIESLLKEGIWINEYVEEGE